MTPQESRRPVTSGSGDQQNTTSTAYSVALATDEAAPQRRPCRACKRRDARPVVTRKAVRASA